MATESAQGVSLDLFGAITVLPSETEYIPWAGPRVRLFEHQAHAVGHAALLIENERVLVAGDMVSDVLIPLLDLNGGRDPVQDYLDALRRFEDIAPRSTASSLDTGPSARAMNFAGVSTRTGLT